VLNPRGIEATDAAGNRVPIIGYSKGGEDYLWYEGDVFTPPEGFDSDGRLLREGFYEEVT